MTGRGVAYHLALNGSPPLLNPSIGTPMSATPPCIAAVIPAFNEARAVAAVVSGVRPHVDVVYVATPQSRHADDACRYLDAGKHVLCEKPMAMTEAAEEAGALPRGPGHQRRGWRILAVGARVWGGRGAARPQAI